MDLQVFTKDETILYEGGALVFLASKPIIVQPSEIMKVITGVSIRVPTGYVINISTAADLAARAAELFPGLIAVSPSEEEIELSFPVRNNGRNPLSIMKGQIVAVGYVVKTEEVNLTISEPQNGKQVSPAESKPQKKNPNIKFEIR